MLLLLGVLFLFELLILVTEVRFDIQDQFYKSQADELFHTLLNLTYESTFNLMANCKSREHS